MKQQLASSYLCAQMARQHQEVVPVGYDCKLTGPPPEGVQIYCPVCRLIIRNPFKVDCCETSYCKQCIDRVRFEKKSCLSCRALDILVFPDMKLRSELNSLRVHCCYQECEWTGTLSQLDVHLVEFGATCGSIKVNCSVCSKLLLRKHMDRHILKECPLKTINCDFHHVGCTETLLRRDMSEHLKENLTKHMSLLAISHAKQRDEIATCCCTSQQAQIERNKKEIAELTEQNAHLKSMNENLYANFPSYFTNIRWSQRAIPSIPVLPLENFAAVGSKDMWHSDAVYTHYQGYKICLGVYTCGTESGTGSHVSVFVCFMMGEFDNTLVWPFRGVISFQLLDQRDNKEHQSLSVVYDEGVNDRVCNQVTDCDVAQVGRGSNKFILISELKPRYLQKNRLLFRIHDVLFHVKTV